MRDNIVEITLSENTFVAETVRQYDKGLKIQITNIECLPEICEIHLANKWHDEVALRSLCTNGIADLYDQYTKSGENIYGWVYVPQPDNSITTYDFIIPVERRAIPCECDVEPEQVDFVSQTIAAMSAIVEQTSQDALSANSAKRAAIAAQEAAEEAQGKAETAQRAAEDAQGFAEAAKTDAEAEKRLAVGAKEAAEEAKRLADSASDNAAESARNAHTSEENASEYRRLAVAAKDAAEEAQRNAEQSKRDAKASEDNASSSETNAAESARAAAESARQANASSSTAGENVRMAADYALKAEGYATGKQDGVVSPSSPYNENNAEYFKDEARAKALISEGYAVGRQNGVSVGNESPYHENNVLYYKEQTEQLAQNAGRSNETSGANALKSEGFATGKQNGVSVGNDSPYHHNNAEYFRDQASQSATNAAESEDNAEAWAKGTVDGTPVVSGKAGFHDNSWYYKEQAKESAEHAGGSETNANRDALKAEGFAVGKQNNVAVGSGGVYYQNNAEYFKEQAESASGVANDAAELARGYADGKHLDGSDNTSLSENNAKYHADRAATEAGKITGMTAQASTLSPGSSATASFANGVLTLGIPAGANGTNGTNGQDGEPGVGVPSGGTTGQVLKKKSGTDYDTEWGNEPSVPVTDVQVNGTSILSNGVANVPEARTGQYGVLKAGGALRSGSEFVGGTAGVMYVVPSSDTGVKNGISETFPITPSVQHRATFYGLAKAAGDSTQSSSSNAVGTYTETAKSKIHEMLDAPEMVSGTTPSITGKAGVRYICGEVSTISITPPQSGIIDVVFTSGTTPAVLTVPNTVKWPVWFDPTSLDASCTYELNIIDGIYGTVGIWMQ